MIFAKCFVHPADESCRCSDVLVGVVFLNIHRHITSYRHYHLRVSRRLTRHFVLWYGGCICRGGWPTHKMADPSTRLILCSRSVMLGSADLGKTDGRTTWLSNTAQDRSQKCGGPLPRKIFVFSPLKLCILMHSGGRLDQLQPNCHYDVHDISRGLTKINMKSAVWAMGRLSFQH